MNDPGPSQRDDLISADLDEAVRREFLLQAGLLNLGVLTGGAGLVMLAFTGHQAGGLALAVGGIVLVGTAVWRYRREAPSS